MQNSKRKINAVFIGFFTIIYFFSICIMPRIQISVFPELKVGADIILGSLISFSLLRGRKTACIFALVLGFAVDIYANPYMFSPVVYFLCAYLVKPASAPFSKKSPLSCLVISAQVLLIKEMVSIFYLTAVLRDVKFSHILLKAVVPEYLLCIAASVIMLVFMKAVMAVFKIPVKGPDTRWNL